jgi:hypothetical protein
MRRIFLSLEVRGSYIHAYELIDKREISEKSHLELSPANC